MSMDKSEKEKPWIDIMLFADIIAGILILAVFNMSGGPTYQGVPVSIYILGIPAWLAVCQAFKFIGYILRPAESKIIDHAHRSKKPLQLLQDDTGAYELQVVQNVDASGSVQLGNGWVGIMMRPTAQELFVEAPDASEPSGKKLKHYPDVTAALKRLTTKAGTLKKSKITLLVGYAGKGVVTNVKTVAALNYAKETTEPQIDVDEEEQPTPAFTKLKRAIHCIWPVDLQSLKEYIPATLNQAQIKSLIVTARNIGYKKAEAHFKREQGALPWVLIIGAVMMIASLVLAIIAHSTGAL